LIAIQARDQDSIDTALNAAEASLSGNEENNASGAATRLLPRSTEMALDEFPEANLALISCPGDYAGAEARKALRLGLDVMIFSDNVAIEDEVALKRLAQDSGRLVMGPDSGTAIINGVPLGFANAVAPGDIGIVAASGTGLQQVTCLIDNLGCGISQAIGTGGRDLSAAVGGLTMLKGLEILACDDSTRVIVLISKPPAAEVARKVMARASDCGKPVVVNFLGGADTTREGNICYAETLEQASHMAVDISQGQDPSARTLPRHHLGEAEISRLISSLPDTRKYVRGLFSGGTFSYEAMLLLANFIGPVNSPSPLKAAQKLSDPWKSTGNTVLDLGDDVFTRGRPHPMIDHRLRHDRLLQEVQDRETAVILLDVVIGHGSHSNPANEVAASIIAARQLAEQDGGEPVFIAFVCGTKSDRQNLDRQEEILRDAGVIVVENNAQAARLAGDILLGR
jgi:succinyl-CoA synthetase alpha subunit